MAEDVEVPKQLLWDYAIPPGDLLWRLQRIADWFPAFGHDRRTVSQLFTHRDELTLAPETHDLIELYEDVWRAHEGRCGARRSDTRAA